MLQEAFKYFLFTSAILVLILSASVNAEELRGQIIRTDGAVHIIDSRGNHQAVEDSSIQVREMDTIVTAESGNAIVRFNDGVLSVLDENSRLRVEKTRWLSHLGGKIYFTFSKVFGNPRQVKTRFATLGIRGTTFIIYDDDNGQGVALQEGLLDIESPGPAYEIHRQQVLDGFEDFKQQALQQQQGLQQQYDDYRKQMQHELVEYEQNFTMQPNHVIQFDGVLVNETLIDENVAADFESFEAIAGELLDEFRKESRAHRERSEEEKRAKELEDESLFDDY